MYFSPDVWHYILTFVFGNDKLYLNTRVAGIRNYNSVVKNIPLKISITSGSGFPFIVLSSALKNPRFVKFFYRNRYGQLIVERFILGRLNTDLLRDMY